MTHIKQSLFRTLSQTWFQSEQYEFTTKTTFKDDKYFCIAIDPGVNTFMTYYSPHYGYGQIGIDFQEKLLKYCKKIDRIYCALDNDDIPNRIKKKLSKKLPRKIQKWKACLDELYSRISIFLSETFCYILLPSFDFELYDKKCLLKNEKTKLFFKTSFKDLYKILLKKCKFNNSYVFIVDEYLTTKTCCMCDSYNDVYGRIYNCKNCCNSMSRDHNACVNIYKQNIHLIFV